MILNGTPLLLRKISNDRIIPPDYDLSEEWVIPPGGIIPHWILRLLGRPPPDDDFEEELAEKEDPRSAEVISNEDYGNAS